LKGSLESIAYIRFQPDISFENRDRPGMPFTGVANQITRRRPDSAETSVSLQRSEGEFVPGQEISSDFFLPEFYYGVWSSSFLPQSRKFPEHGMKSPYFFRDLRFH
jgi:hypothetical protein